MSLDGAGMAFAATQAVGRLDVVALVDASGPFFRPRNEVLLGATDDDWEQAQRIDPGAFGADGEWRLDFRCFAIRRPDGRVALIDAGVGPEGSPASSWAPVPGHLPERLASIGIRTEDVDLVVLTHLHGDHLGWSVSPDGVPTFPNARYALQRTEIAALEENNDQVVLPRVVDPLRQNGQLDVLDGRVCLFRQAAGRIAAVPTPGHTPGHQSVLVEAGRDRIAITGDVLVHAVQLANPEVAYLYEQDQETARRTRRALLANASRTHTILATAHLNRPFVPSDEAT
ncbi:MBL fold metallo-hydrolase [Amycolatopsis taiwanensis]|uniref:MBL fold metallo-hydrolase n=1 Tax=Amycolatopsis taiwanensis TaxID=342230 RepID=A0A9W6R053_9PSEU|nr:MBL fold metallo-hydrolase [Amycolatopsis taiwanensis]GLY65207.1 MBL fold metallo-hydrolase [Amycolatopsis taiwanensis]